MTARAERTRLKLTAAGRSELAHWLRSAGLPVSRSDDAAFATWVDWLLVQRGQTTPMAARTITDKWRTRLEAVECSPYAGSEGLARARAHNLWGLALGAGGVINLAALAQRTRFHLQRLLDGQRQMGERGARGLEAALHLEAGWLDTQERPLAQSIAAGRALKAATGASGKVARRKTRTSR